MQDLLEQLRGLDHLKVVLCLWQHQLVCLSRNQLLHHHLPILHFLGLIDLVPDHHLPALFDFLFPFLIDVLFCSALFSFIKRANMILNKHPEIKTTFLCLVENIEIPHNHNICFHKPENIGTRCKEKGSEDNIFFIVPKMFDFFIRGERRVAYDFRKITDLAIYLSIKKSGPDDQSRSQLSKLILEEAMEIVIENHGENKLDGTIQDVRNGVKELQLLGAQVPFPFETEIIQVITETQCVLYDHSMLGEGALFGKEKYGVT
jgi:hypothetical protein